MASAHEKMEQAQALIKAKRYEEARRILKNIDHPTARDWLAKVDQRIAATLPDFPDVAPTPRQAPHRVTYEAPVLPNRVRQLKLWRNIWGVFTLLAIGWGCYGLVAFSSASDQNSSNSMALGAGAMMGLSIFLCTGLPFVLLFGFLYMRAGNNIREEIQHAEMLAAMRGQ